jgi:2-(1,2-epoxy-1,2-dihydrophenyl)acetyl-CoA isomerase
MILNPRLSAAEALDLGLVTSVVADDDLAGEVAALAQKLSDGPYLAWGHIKRNLLTAESEPLAAVLEAEAASLARLSITEDHREAIRAFGEKRPPVFRGR